MRYLITTCLLLLLLFRCAPERAGDPKDLERALTAYYDGIAAADLQRLNDAVTPDFVLFEDGRVFNNDSLMKVLKSFGTYQASFDFEILKVNAGRETGSMYYKNKGSFTFNDTSHLTFRWLESAVFRKADDAWKIEFLHSTLQK